MIHRHFRENEAGQGFLDFQREQAHGGRIALTAGGTKPGLLQETLFSGFENNLAPGRQSGDAVRAANFMAAKDNKKRGELPEPTRWSNEIIKDESAKSF